MVPQVGLIKESLLASRASMGEITHVLLQMPLVASFRSKLLITQNASKVSLENGTWTGILKPTHCDSEPFKIRTKHL